jgi:hypothetical protein
MDELELKRAQARARARARAAAAQAQGEGPDTSFLQPELTTSDKAIRDLNTGLYGWIPGVRQEDSTYVRPPGENAEGILGTAMETAGIGLGTYLGGGALLQTPRLLQQAAGRTAPIVERAGREAIGRLPGASTAPFGLLDDIATTMVRHPVSAPVLEGVAGAGAGAGIGLGDAIVDANPEMNSVAQGVLPGALGIAGGIGAPVAATGGLAGRGWNFVKTLPDRAREAGVRFRAPDTASVGGQAWGPGGGRAARRVQDLAPDPQAAAQALDAPTQARRPGDPAPELSPARATGENNLIALEELQAARDPVFRQNIERARSTAADTLENDVRQLFGSGRTPAGWRQGVMQRVTAPDAPPIQPGSTDEMLEQAARSFDPAYEAAKGYPVYLTRLGTVADNDRPLHVLIGQAVNDTNLPAGALTPKQRARMTDELFGQLEDVARRTGMKGLPEGTVDSGTMLEFRRAIRDEIRATAKAAGGAGKMSAKERARLQALENVEDRITGTLESQLPEDVLAGLKATDARYRDFKTVEDAVWRGGDTELTPEVLYRSIKGRESRSALAQGRLETPTAGLTGEEGSLLTVSRHGVDIKKLRGDADRAARVTRGMDAEQLRALKSDYVQDMMERVRNPVEARSSVDAGRTTGFVDGARLMSLVDDEAEQATLRAIGFTDSDLNNVRRVAAQLELVSRRSPKQIQEFITDRPGVLLRMVAAAAGSSAGRWVAHRMGGGMTHSLIIAQTGARIGREQAHQLVVDNAQNLLTRALEPTDEGRALMRALLTRPTDPPNMRAEAGRRINAWMMTLPDYEAIVNGEQTPAEE